jgi:hypothetical protein
MTNPIDEILDKRFKTLSEDLCTHQVIRHLKKLGITAGDVHKINQQKLAGDTDLPSLSTLEKWFRNDQKTPFDEKEDHIIDLAMVLEACLEALKRVDGVKYQISESKGADEIIEPATEYVKNILY